MTRPAVATWGTSSAQIKIEYVKGRRVLRLALGAGDGESVEVALEEFCASLGIDVAQLAPPQRYLLFAGLGDEPGASPHHVVATFPDEQGARDAFRALRLGHSQPGDWAEVAVVEASGGLRQLCWFGTPWGPRGRSSRASAIARPTSPIPVRSSMAQSARWRLRRSLASRRATVLNVTLGTVPPRQSQEAEPEEVPDRGGSSSPAPR